MTLSPEQKTYLELFTNLLFELPIKDEEAALDLSHEDVVYQLNRDLLEFGCSLGINGSQLDPGIYAEYVTIFAKVPVQEFGLAVQWLKRVLFSSVFTREQMLITISNLLKEITKRKTQPNDIIHALSNDLYFREESNMCANNFLRQENFLRGLQEKLMASGNDEATFIHEMLESVRTGLLKVLVIQ
jgi:Zn-dependent M16 (insulinase) family peptidase